MNVLFLSLSSEVWKVFSQNARSVGVRGVTRVCSCHSEGLGKRERNETRKRGPGFESRFKDQPQISQPC